MNSNIYSYIKLVTERKEGKLLFGILYMKSINKPTLIKDNQGMGMTGLFTPSIDKYEDNGYAEIEDTEWFETEIDRYIYLNN